LSASATFNGAADKGWIIIPCELIDYNGDALRELVLRYAQEWALPAAFTQWLNDANSFCSTLVDRIVTGYPRDEVAALEANWVITMGSLIPLNTSICLLFRALNPLPANCVWINAA
jgi:mannitol-1-phosphate/altronate dehydrogenase